MGPGAVNFPAVMAELRAIVKEMKPHENKPSAPTAVFTRGANDTKCYRIPLAVRVPCKSGPRCNTAGYVLLAFVEARSISCCDFGPKRIGMTRSWDAGQSWEPQSTVWTDPTNVSAHQASCGGPSGGKCYGCDYVGSNLGAVVYDKHTKEVLLHFTFQPCEEHQLWCIGMMVASSGDWGATWTFRNITKQFHGIVPSAPTSKIGMPWNGGPGTGVQLPTGRLIIPGFDRRSHPIYSDVRQLSLLDDLP